MQALSQAVHRFSYDVFDEDSYTYVPGEAKAEMARIIQNTEQVLETLREDLAPHLPPAGSDADPIYKYWRKGGCFLDISNEAACDVPALYNDAVGYTKTLAKSGIEHQLFNFIESAKAYLKEEQYIQKTNSPLFQLMEYQNKAFYKNLDVLIRQYNDYSAQSTLTATAALFSLATCVFISFEIYYRIGFSNASNKFKANNRQLICLVFSVNQADRMKAPELNTFVESAGASIN